jgi:hypothetical protein
MRQHASAYFTYVSTTVRGAKIEPTTAAHLDLHVSICTLVPVKLGNSVPARRKQPCIYIHTYAYTHTHTHTHTPRSPDTD